MITYLNNFFITLRQLLAFWKIDRSRRRIVFYSEGGEYWTHFEPIIYSLLKKYSEKIIYVTSSKKDPNFKNPPSGMQSFFIGKGSIRTIFFSTLDVEIIIMTMPDLNTFHIKRSPFPVKYIYIHHSLVSTHMTYRPQAFDHFDIIFCAGPHHKIEIEAREKIYKLKHKCLFQHGYGRLDKLITLSNKKSYYPNKKSKKCVLIAPSWGEKGLLEVHGIALIGSLLKSGIHTIVRPHPMTLSKNPKLIDIIQNNFANNPNYLLDLDVNSNQSLLMADIMISDWSGSAFDFSFGLLKPVIFIDTFKKVNNSNYYELEINPLEITIRKKIGVLISEKNIDTIGPNISKILEKTKALKKDISMERDRWVYNLGKSGEVAADKIYSLL